jgi:ABC-2 type transport system ATP-binding protein
MIEVSDLTKRYGDFEAVSGVSFSGEKGQIIGFLGPNGAGKTTTIRMLSTFLPPTSGSAKVAGYDIIKQSDQVRRRIGYLPENPPLYSEMKVTEYLTFVARIKNVSRSKVKSHVEEAISLCFLKDVAHKLCGHLSKGYRQRVGLAQAIVHNPEVIILDEPTSGLDPRQIIEIRQLISSLAKERTVILSTHILPEVSMVCTRVVIINRGRVIVEAELSELTRERTLEQVFLEAVAKETLEEPSSILAAT